MVPMLSSLVSQYGGDHQKVGIQSCCSRLKDYEQGAVMGVFRSLGALGRALGPAFGSLLFWSLGPGTIKIIKDCSDVQIHRNLVCCWWDASSHSVGNSQECQALTNICSTEHIAIQSRLVDHKSWKLVIIYL